MGKRKHLSRLVGLGMSASIIIHPAAHAKGQDLREKTTRKTGSRFGEDAFHVSPFNDSQNPLRALPQQYPWKYGIVTTTFWIGEKPTQNNPVPNHKSSWDMEWAENYGGTDTPERSKRSAQYTPKDFIPRQNPFYVALPYNDMTKAGHKPEVSKVVPWYKDVYRDDHQSVLKGRWITIRKGNRVCYAQWEDCGPFRTDHWQYVFGNERPRPNLNKGAGLDVSPAVRDFLGMDDTDVTDWKFVEFREVPTGPWSVFGDNNTFVINRRAAGAREATAELGSVRLRSPDEIAPRKLKE